MCGRWRDASDLTTWALHLRDRTDDPIEEHIPLPPTVVRIQPNFAKVLRLCLRALAAVVGVQDRALRRVRVYGDRVDSL